MNVMRTWIRLALNPSTLRRSLATAAVVGVILTLVNHGGEVLGGGLRPDHMLPIAFTFIVPFVVATVSSVAVVRGAGSPTRRGTRLNDELEAVRTFPDSNPNPVLRIASSGQLLYANAASRPLLRALNAGIGDGLPAELIGQLRVAAVPVEVEAEGRTYQLRSVAIDQFDFMNVYGTEVADREASQATAA